MSAPALPRRVVVTGAQGFIGSRVLAAADRLGIAEIVAICGTSPWRWSPLDHPWEVHVLERPWWLSAAPVTALAGGADAAILLDYTPPSRHADPLAHERDVNAVGTARLAAELARTGARVVVASSAEVYGGTGARTVDEHSATAPVTPYGWAKLKMEQMCADVAGRGTALRIGTTFGAGETSHRAIPTFARALLAGRRPVVHGRGDDVRDYIHVDDVALACVLAAAGSGEGWTTYNVGTGRGRSTHEVLSVVAQAVGVPARPLHVPAPRPPRSLVLDGGALARSRGFVATTPFGDAVAEEVAWLRDREVVRT